MVLLSEMHVRPGSAGVRRIFRWVLLLLWERSAFTRLEGVPAVSDLDWNEMQTRSRKEVVGSVSHLWPPTLLPLRSRGSFCEEPKWFVVQTPTEPGRASGTGTAAYGPHRLLPLWLLIHTLPTCLGFPRTKEHCSHLLGCSFLPAESSSFAVSPKWGVPLFPQLLSPSRGACVVPMRELRYLCLIFMLSLFEYSFFLKAKQQRRPNKTFVK